MNITDIVVKELGITSKDIEASENLDWLKRLRVELDFVISRLDYDLDNYNSNYAGKSVLDNSNWFKRTKSKRRLYGTVTLLLQNRMGVLGKQEKAARHKSVTEILIAKLKQNMDKDLFCKLADEAHSEYANYENKKL